jgi:hypothetical protein
MRNTKKLMRLTRMLLFGFMLAVCIVMGVAPVIPKRKEQATIEIKMEETERKEDTTANFITVNKN